MRTCVINNVAYNLTYHAVSVLLCLALILSIGGCSTTSSWSQSLPEADIMFQSTMNVLPYRLDFIREDGSNHQVLQIDANFVRPVWSLDGTFLFGLSNPVGQPAYENIGYPAYWDIKNGSFKVCYKDLPHFTQMEVYNNGGDQNQVILDHLTEIILFDLNTCQQIVKYVDYSDDPGEAAIVGISYFPEKQELLYGKATNPYKSRDYHIINLNLKTGEQLELAKGLNPAWSPDGTEIAYIGLGGLYVMRVNEKQPRQLTHTQFFDPNPYAGPPLDAPQPRWSQDGKWLVYHQCLKTICEVEQTPVYKVRVSDGTQMRLFTGGKYPIWQP